MIPILKRKADDPLLCQIEEARAEWHEAIRLFDFAETTYIDCAVWRINKALAKYMALLKEARKSGLTAWDIPLCPPANKPESAGE